MFERIFTKARKHSKSVPTAYELLRNKDKSITIRRENGDGTWTPERTFAKGDLAEYDSYNFSYFGKIVRITEKSVTIVEEYGSKKHRLAFETFAWRNYDFDLDSALERNRDVSQHI